MSLDLINQIIFSTLNYLGGFHSKRIFLFFFSSYSTALVSASCLSFPFLKLFDSPSQCFVFVFFMLEVFLDIQSMAPDGVTNNFTGNNALQENTVLVAEKLLQKIKNWLAKFFL